MTREEALKFILHNSFKDYENHSVVMFIEKVIELRDKIYDDFESRTCKNCKYFQINIEGEKICLNPYMKRYGDWFETEENFGCNRFERKIDEQDN